MAIKAAKKGYTMDATFEKLLKDVKAIQETPDSGLTDQDREAINNRINREQTYEIGLLMRENKASVADVAKYEKFCKENADAIWQSQKNKYLALRSHDYIASYYWDMYKNNCAQQLEKDILQYLEESSINEFPEEVPFPPNSPGNDPLTKLENKFFILLLYGHTKNAAKRYLSQKVLDFRVAMDILQERHCLPDSQRQKAIQATYRIQDKINAIASNWAMVWKKQGILKDEEIQEIRKEIEVLQKKSKGIRKAQNHDILTNIQTKLPSQYVSPMDKVSMKLFTDFQQFGEGEVWVNTGTLKKPSPVSVQIMYDDSNNSLPSLTIYEKAVLNGLCTLWEAGRPMHNELYYTPEMLYKAMTGNPNAKLRETREKELDATLWKLASYTVVIDAEAEQGMYHDAIPYRVKGHLIDLRQAETDVTINGQKVPNLYRLSSEPLLYTYAKRKGQINKVPLPIINVPINQTDSVIALKNYLLWRISWNTASNNIIIRYDAIFKNLGIDPANRANRKKKSKLYADVEKILDYWQKLGTIKSYKILDSKGRPAKGRNSPIKIAATK